MLEKTKQQLRRFWKGVRKAISIQRKLEAAQALETAFLLFTNYRYVLSYASFKEELCTENVNRQLAKEDKLLLPKICNRSLQIYQVRDFDKDLKKSPLGIWEPNSDFCKRVEVERVCCVLVPGLAFDASKHRLGYGGGYYDRFLKTLSNDAMTFGLGFKEQYHKASLPTSTYDISLKKILLV